MDKETIELLTLKELQFDEKKRLIQKIYSENLGKPLTTETIYSILSSINVHFYNSKLLPYIATTDKPIVLVKDTGNPCNITDAFLEASAYDDSDEEYKKYNYGFNVALTCLNSIVLSDEEVFYSGGFITRDKLMFIILMMLHESLHIIEYKDSFLTTAKSSHTVFFYREAYKLFGIVSRLSELISKSKISQLSISDRIEEINNLPESPISDGMDILNDHSHYMKDKKRVLLGYITYTLPNTYLENKSEMTKGGKKRKARKYTQRKKRNGSSKVRRHKTRRVF